MKRVPPTLLVLALFVPSSSLAQDGSLRDASRVSLYVGGGFGGESALTTMPPNLPDFTFRADLDPSITLGLRYVKGLHDYFTLGAGVGFVFWRADDVDDRNTLFDFSLLPAARYVFDVGLLELEPYLSVPVGLSINRLDESPVGGAGRGSVGLHVGVLAGVTLALPAHVAFFLELGMLHHRLYDEGDADVRFKGRMTQVALHFGASYVF